MEGSSNQMFIKKSYYNCFICNKKLRSNNLNYCDDCNKHYCRLCFPNEFSHKITEEQKGVSEYICKNCDLPSNKMRFEKEEEDPNDKIPIIKPNKTEKKNTGKTKGNQY